MQSTIWLINKLRDAYPRYTFTETTEFRWEPTTSTIFYEVTEDYASLLHELAHALLGHSTYVKDIELITMERDAWHYANTVLIPQYNLKESDDTSEDALDTYRDWLHARSTCPTCKATGIQRSKSIYACLACHAVWKVNEARICALRRYLIN